MKERSLDLHRDIAASVQELGVEVDKVENYVLPGGEPLFPHKMGEDGYLGNNRILGEVYYVLISYVCHQATYKILFVVVTQMFFFQA